MDIRGKYFLVEKHRPKRRKDKIIQARRRTYEDSELDEAMRQGHFLADANHKDFVLVQVIWEASAPAEKKPE